MQPLRIELVDEHELYRCGLRSILPKLQGVELIVEASDARDAIQKARNHQPNLIITDLFLPGPSGVHLVRDLKHHAPDGRVLVLAMRRSEPVALEAFQAGASGYALKEQPADEIRLAIEAVLRGELYLAPSLPRSLMDRTVSTTRAIRIGPLGALSAREREVFDLAVRAFTNEGIGVELGISVKTVETHRARINRKLRVHSTAELVRFAALNDLLAKRAD